MNDDNPAKNVETVIEDNHSKNPSPLRIILILCSLLLILLLTAGTIFIAFNLFNIRGTMAQTLLYRAERWPVQFRDYFDSGPASQFTAWKSTDGTTSDLVRSMRPVNGQFEIDVAPTPQDTGVREAFYNEHALAAGNFLLTTEIITPFACHTGLVFRGNMHGEYYLFLVANDSYTVEILRRNSNGDLPREAIIPNKKFPKGIDQPYTLGVLANRQSYDFYINHIFVDHMSDTRLNGERAGIEVMVCQGKSTQSIFQLDNFTLRAPGNLFGK